MHQQNNDVHKFSVSPAFELLRSTHSNLFYAPSLKVNYLFNNGLEPEIGIEYSSIPVHHDNKYVLYQVGFLPIYGNLKYNFKTSREIRPYAETSLGISFNQYDRAEDPIPDVKAKISEQGFYVYTKFGAKYRISQDINTFLAVGFKGYKMCTNDLDINPHRLSFTFGVTFF